MHPELEALLRAYDATREQQDEDAISAKQKFEALLKETLAARPNLSRESLLRMVWLSHARWLRANRKPPTLPPKA